MAYTLSQIYAALGQVENGGAMVADLQDAISAVRNEAAASRAARNKVLDALGLRGEDSDDAVKRLADTLNVLRKEGDPEALGAKFSDMEKQLKDLTEKYSQSEARANAEREKRLSTARQAAAQAAFAKGNALNPEAFVKLVADNIIAKDDDSLAWKDGEKEVSVEEGVNAWLAENPWAVKNTASGGAGSGGAGGGKTVYTADDLRGMTAEEINKNWEAIQKSMTQKG